MGTTGGRARRSVRRIRPSRPAVRATAQPSRPAQHQGYGCPTPATRCPHWRPGTGAGTATPVRAPPHPCGHRHTRAGTATPARAPPHPRGGSGSATAAGTRAVPERGKAAPAHRGRPLRRTAGRQAFGMSTRSITNTVAFEVGMLPQSTLAVLPWPSVMVGASAVPPMVSAPPASSVVCARGHQALGVVALADDVVGQQAAELVRVLQQALEGRGRRSASAPRRTRRCRARRP